MAVRGRKPKPTAADPTLPAGAPVPPKWLTAPQLALWHEMLPLLPGVGKLDRYVFAMWCVGQSEYNGPGKADWPVSRLAEHRRLGESLMMGPNQRTRMPAETPPEDAGEAFFRS